MKALYKLVLRGSVVSALALVTAAVGCSDTNKDDETGAGGEPGKAGSSSTAGSSNNPGGAGGDAPTTAGTAGAGGAEGGAGPTEGGAAGAGGAPVDRPDIVFSAGGDGAGGASDEPAVAKFCNSLTFGTDDNPMDTTMILEIGEGNDKVTFTALSGTCAPADGAECKPIPLGDAVPVALFDADAPDTALDEGTIKSRGGSNWIFYTDLTEEAEPTPIVGGAPFESPACEDIIFEDVF